MNPKVLQRLFAALFVIVLVQVACGQQYRRVKQVGYSMKPNITDGDILKIQEVPLSELKRGDIIMIENNGNFLIKRLIALPNETISIQEGKIFINGTLLDEPYEIIPATYSVDEIKLDSDSYYVLGDNRPDSLDSRILGPIKGSQIKGKAIP